MEVHFTAEIEKKLHDLAAQRGLPADELVQDAVAGFFDELHQSGELEGAENLTPDAAVERILELQKHVKPDPEGWTVKDYIEYGRP